MSPFALCVLSIVALSVVGLPVESGSGGPDIVAITNRNYRAVMRDMQVMVSSTTLLVRGGDAGTAIRNSVPRAFEYANGPINIDRSVWIAAHAIVLPSVSVQSGTVVPAGTVVRRGSTPRSPA